MVSPGAALSEEHVQRPQLGAAPADDGAGAAASGSSGFAGSAGSAGFGEVGGGVPAAACAVAAAAAAAARRRFWCFWPLACSQVQSEDQCTFTSHTRHMRDWRWSGCGAKPGGISVCTSVVPSRADAAAASCISLPSSFAASVSATAAVPRDASPASISASAAASVLSCNAVHAAAAAAVPVAAVPVTAVPVAAVHTPTVLIPAAAATATTEAPLVASCRCRLQSRSCQRRAAQEHEQ